MLLSATLEGIILNVLIWYLWLIPLLLLHEFGHALVGRIVGFKLLWISLGHGRQILDRRFLGLRLRINLIPFSGMTLSVPRTLCGLRWRLWSFTFAGPAVHLLSIFVCYLILGHDFFRTHLFSTSILSRTIPTEMFIYANLFLLFVNLFTKHAGTSKGNVHSDGYRLLSIPFLSQNELEGYKILDIGIKALEEVEAGNIDQAIIIYESGLKIDPQSYMLRHDLALCRLKQGRYEQARMAFIELLNSKEAAQADYRVLLLNNIAWVDVVLGKDELLVEADKYSEEAIKKEPETTSFIGTRGAVLVRTGRTEEGLRMLRNAFRRHSDKSARASVACWIAIGEALRWNIDGSNKWLEKAREELPNHYLLSVAEQEIRMIMLCHNR